jgi:hypothetical protein
MRKMKLPLLALISIAKSAHLKTANFLTKTKMTIRRNSKIKINLNLGEDQQSDITMLEVSQGNLKARKHKTLFPLIKNL